MGNRDGLVVLVGDHRVEASMSADAASVSVIADVKLADAEGVAWVAAGRVAVKD